MIKVEGADLATPQGHVKVRELHGYTPWLDNYCFWPFLRFVFCFLNFISFFAFFCVVFCHVMSCHVMSCHVMKSCLLLWSNMLYCVALCCVVLYHTVLRCVVLHCIVMDCIVMYCIVLCCIVLRCIVLLLYSIKLYYICPTCHKQILHILHQASFVIRLASVQPNSLNSEKKIYFFTVKFDFKSIGVITLYIILKDSLIILVFKYILCNFGFSTYEIIIVEKNYVGIFHFRLWDPQKKQKIMMWILKFVQPVPMNLNQN